MVKEVGVTANMICWASGFLGTYFSRVPRMPLVRRSEPIDAGDDDPGGRGRGGGDPFDRLGRGVATLDPGRRGPGDRGGDQATGKPRNSSRPGCRRRTRRPDSSARRTARWCPRRSRWRRACYSGLHRQTCAHCAHAWRCARIARGHYNFLNTSPRLQGASYCLTLP